VARNRRAIVLAAPTVLVADSVSPRRPDAAQTAIFVHPYILYNARGRRGMADCQALSPCALGRRSMPPVPNWRETQNRGVPAVEDGAMRSFRKWLFGALVRLAMVPLSLPCLFATCCCCSVAFGSGEADCQSPGEGLVFSLGAPLHSPAHSSVHNIDPHRLAKGTTGTPHRCGCCPVNSDAKRPAVLPRSTENRTKPVRGIRLVFHAGGILSDSRAFDSRSSVSARAASCPTSAENCILLCRLLL
jgi:hypothetical protein